jgi:hypothetical protein
LFNISVKRDVQPTILDVVSAKLAKPKDVSLCTRYFTKMRVVAKSLVKTPLRKFTN